MVFALVLALAVVSPVALGDIVPGTEFTLVDGAGRVQIPREYLDELKIKDRARVVVEDDKVTLQSGDA